jgi:phosphoenolpyruvate---glycerone phosphotransferase subunit DhaL
MKLNNKEAAIIVDKLIDAIQANKQYLSDIDGLIGDGDHGVNMNKGFTMCRQALDADPGDLSHSMLTLAKILMLKIGGSMGPLYGKFFKGFALEIKGIDEITMEDYNRAIAAMFSSIQSISPAKPGDKTLVDTLAPAVAAFDKATKSGKSFSDGLDDLIHAAIEGRDSTKEMTAQLGRASRLGERSRGVLDAGATSCCLILETMATNTKLLLK